MHFITRTIEPAAGETVFNAASYVCELARLDRYTRYALLFNGVWLRVGTDADPADVVREYFHEDSRRKQS